MDDAARYKRATKIVHKLKGFYQHLTVYVLVNAFLFLINIVTSPGKLWFYWPLLGWGIGVAIHGLSAFGSSGLVGWGTDWEERKIKELMQKDTR